MKLLIIKYNENNKFKYDIYLYPKIKRINNRIFFYSL